MSTPYDVAERLRQVVKEVPGDKHDPWILHAHRLCTMRATTDEVPWCSAMIVALALEFGLVNTYSAAARSWLAVGEHVELEDARKGFDVVISKRGRDPQPGPDVLNAPGHVSLYARQDDMYVYGLGGNTRNQIDTAPIPVGRILGIRRLHREVK